MRMLITRTVVAGVLVIAGMVTHYLDMPLTSLWLTVCGVTLSFSTTAEIRRRVK